MLALKRMALLSKADNSVLPAGLREGETLAYFYLIWVSLLLLITSFPLTSQTYPWAQRQRKPCHPWSLSCRKHPSLPRDWRIKLWLGVPAPVSHATSRVHTNFLSGTHVRLIVSSQKGFTLISPFCLSYQDTLTPRWCGSVLMSLLRSPPLCKSSMRKMASAPWF